MIVPGSKNTLTDLSYLREQGYSRILERHVCSGRELVGICGGYQMLGRTISDSHHVEQGGISSGLGYLSIETELSQKKCTEQVEANPTDTLVADQTIVRGYQVHMGVTVYRNERPCFRLQRRVSPIGGAHSLTAVQEDSCDGAIREDGLVWGTYIHGVFDEPSFRRAWLNRARARKGLLPVGVHTSRSVTARLRGELDRWTDHLSRSLDMARLLSCLSHRRIFSL